MYINRRPILGKNRTRFAAARRPRRINYQQIRKEVIATSDMLVILRASDFVKKHADSAEAVNTLH